MKSYDILLFDADETLFDFQAASHAAIAQVLTQFGIEPCREYIALYEAINTVQWLRGDRGELTQDEITENRFRFFLLSIGREDMDAIALNEAYKAQLAQQSILFDGALELIAQLHEKGYRMAIVTNGLAQVQHGRFATSPITPYFEQIFISEEVGARKPEPEMLTHVLREMQATDLRRVVMIGDNLQSDILGGNLVNIDTIWYNSRVLAANKDIQPTKEVRNYAELLAALGEE